MAGALNQTNLGSPVVSRSLSWTDFAMRAWGTEFHAPDHNTYLFSNGRGFDSTDQSHGGVYGVLDQNYLMITDSHYPDMPSNTHMLQDNGYKIVIE